MARTWVIPDRWNDFSSSSGMSERSPSTIPRTTAASRGLRPYPSARSVRRCTWPIQPRSSPTGLTLVASTSALILLVARYQFQSTKSPELIFSALVDDDGAHNVRFERVL